MTLGQRKRHTRSSTGHPGLNLLRLTNRGLYCAAGDFYIDPWRPVTRAIVTHAHSDHATPGSSKYLACEAGRAILTRRLGQKGRKTFLPYGRVHSVNGVKISLHPAGHVLGSAQIRLEYRGHVWAVTGDYKLESDPTCAGFEPVPCDVFVTETTFGLPVYRWPEPANVIASMNDWWRQNQELGRASVVYAYALGKAQRILASLDDSIGPLFAHGAVHQVNLGYIEDGVAMPGVTHATEANSDTDWSKALIVAVPSAHGTPWLKRFGRVSTAAASGWMRVRGTRRRRAVDRGFVLSDHVDWPSLLKAVEASQAREVWTAHGYTHHVARYLEEQGYATRTLDTRPRGDEDSEVDNKAMVPIDVNLSSTSGDEELSREDPLSEVDSDEGGTS